MDLRMITPWSMNVIALSLNDTMILLVQKKNYCTYIVNEHQTVGKKIMAYKLTTSLPAGIYPHHSVIHLALNDQSHNFLAPA